MSIKEGLLSVVVRTMAGRELECLRALQGIAASSHRSIEIILVYQGRAEDVDTAAIQTAAAHRPVAVLGNPTKADERSRNLNIGWEAAKGRYIAFLDDDDNIEPNHYSLLIGALCGSDKAWAYSRTALRAESADLQLLSETFPFDRPQFSLLELWRQNFIPIHSFLIDRFRLPEIMAQRPFCEALTRGEDWDFLLHLAYYREPLYVDTVSCYYYVSAERGNTNQSIRPVEVDAATAQRDAAEWARCKVLVLARRAELDCLLYTSPSPRD